MRRIVGVGLGAIAIALAGCTSDDSVSDEGQDGAPPAIDATSDVSIGQHDASGAHDANVADATDATIADAGTDAPADAAPDAPADAAADAAADAVADAAPDAVADAAPDVFDAGPPEDAFSFPDAQSLSGLHIGILGDTGSSSEAMLDAYLATAATVTRIEDSADAGGPLDATTLGAFDVILLDQLIRSYTQAEAQALADWIAAGHGVLSLTGYTGGGPDGTRPSSLLAVVGLGYDTSSLLTNTATPPLISHPLMDGVATLNFYGGWAATSPLLDGGADAGADAGAVVVVAMVDTTHPALIARDFGAGRVVVWGDEWISYDSEFQNNQGTERFWNNALLWLTHRK